MNTDETRAAFEREYANHDIGKDSYGDYNHQPTEDAYLDFCSGWQAATAAAEEKIARLQALTNVQCSDGNWNCNSYMHGMANGMIYIMAMMKNEEPKYLKAPDVWLDDLPQSRLAPTSCEALAAPLLGENTPPTPAK